MRDVHPPLCVVHLQAKEVSQAAARPHAAPTAEEQDMRQCMYATEWQVSEAAAVASGSLKRRHLWPQLAWTAGEHATARQTGSILHSGAGAAAAAAQATLRQARLLQHIMAAPGMHTPSSSSVTSATSYAQVLLMFPCEAIFSRTETFLPKISGNIRSNSLLMLSRSEIPGTGANDDARVRACRRHCAAPDVRRA